MQIKTINENYKNYLLVEQEEINKWSKDFFTEILTQKNVYFFSTKKPTEGYLIARKVFNDYEILALATSKLRRRQGLAVHLLSNLIKKAKRNKIKKILLEVSKNNQAAIKLYSKLGFNKAGERKKYYKTTTGWLDAEIMSKVIT